MNYKFKKLNYNFWLKRIKKKNKVCTNDIALNKLETKQIIDHLKNNSSILEVGCGNGTLYKDIYNCYKSIKYTGIDIVKELIFLCKKKLKNKNGFFKVLDMTKINKNTFEKKFDFIVSKRAIQNILNHKIQCKVIDNLGFFLKKKGLMILVESSSTSQKN